MAKLTDNTKKNLNNEKYDIDYILYGKIKPSKYEDDNLFNKDISKNLRKSIEKDKSNEKNDNNINLIQNENTTDSFKKNKINVSFIENQNN